MHMSIIGKCFVFLQDQRKVIRQGKGLINKTLIIRQTYNSVTDNANMSNSALT